MKNNIKHWFQSHVNKYTTRYALRISIGIILAILITEVIGIQFAPSTGVVMLLSLQATRKETLITIFKKIISLGYTMGFAILVHEYVGTSSLAFSLVILLMVVLSIYLGWYNTLSVNVVIAVHLFITQDTFTRALFMNEIYRVFIGMGIAFLINLRGIDIESQITKQIHELELLMQNILLQLADYLDGKIALPDTVSQLKTFHQMTDQGRTNALIYSNNHLLSHAKYYENYMNMRENDCLLLEHIYSYLGNTNLPDIHAPLLAEYTRHIANTLHIARPVDEWSEKYQQVTERLEQEKLPVSRFEFHAQAIQLYILYDLSKMLEERKHFLASISKTQRTRYLKEQ